MGRGKTKQDWTPESRGLLPAFMGLGGHKGTFSQGNEKTWLKLAHLIGKRILSNPALEGKVAPDLVLGLWVPLRLWHPDTVFRGGTVSPGLFLKSQDSFPHWSCAHLHTHSLQGVHDPGLGPITV